MNIAKIYNKKFYSNGYVIIKDFLNNNEVKNFENFLFLWKTKCVIIDRKVITSDILWIFLVWYSNLVCVLCTCKN